MDKKLKLGDEIPDFKVKDFEGEVVTKDDLLGGGPFVIYFYPKDNTSGCTAQACELRDTMEAFDDLDILVIGVSPDDAKTHAEFMEKNELNFPLFCDQDLAMAKSFGAVEGTSIVRSTYLFDEDGILQWMESPANVENHAGRLLKAVEEAFA